MVEMRFNIDLICVISLDIFIVIFFVFIAFDGCADVFVSAMKVI